jgi:hypothetical protein
LGLERDFAVGLGNSQSSGVDSRFRGLVTRATNSSLAKPLLETS